MQSEGHRQHLNGGEAITSFQTTLTMPMAMRLPQAVCLSSAFAQRLPVSPDAIFQAARGGEGAAAETHAAHGAVDCRLSWFGTAASEMQIVAAAHRVR